MYIAYVLVRVCAFNRMDMVMGIGNFAVLLCPTAGNTLSFTVNVHYLSVTNTGDTLKHIETGIIPLIINIICFICFSHVSIIWNECLCSVRVCQL